MIAGVHLEVVLAAAYALVLVVAAVLLERLARQAHRRAERYQTVGFTYHAQLDGWVCPADQRLHRIETDPVRRVSRYRAPAHACNACHLKGDCTDSDDGRTLEHRDDSWLESELRRFHRGLSVTLLVLATVILAAEIIRHDRPRELAIAATVCVPVAASAMRLGKELLVRKP